MLAFASDEDLNARIVRGLLRRVPDLDIVRIADVGLSGADDPTVLEWAAQAGRVLLTHDVSTITRRAYERVNAGAAMPGVVEISQGLSVARAIDDLVLLATTGTPQDCDGQIVYLPL